MTNSPIKHNENTPNIVTYVTGGDPEHQNALNSYFIKHLVKGNDYVPLERTDFFLKALIKENVFKISGHVADSQITELGRQAGAKYICIAEIMPVKNNHFVTSRLIDINRNMIIATSIETGYINSIKKLEEISNKLVSEMLTTQTNKSITQKKRIAIRVTGNEGGKIDLDTKKILAAALVDAFSKSPDYIALERTSAYLNLIDTETEFQVCSGNIADDAPQAVCVGERLGVDFICVADITTSNLDGKHILDISFVDVKERIYAPDKFAQQQFTSTNLNSLMFVAQSVAFELGMVYTKPINPILNIEMVFVEGGTFTMGCTEEKSECCPDESPAHKVKLSSYYISKYLVTQELWLEVMKNNPSKCKGENLPVEYVNWYDVQDFIKKLNQLTGKLYRLPTEAEWEFAARGGNKSKGYKYSGSNNINDVAWNDVNSKYTTFPVGLKQPNELGIYDMSGNVGEWCNDWYGNYSVTPKTNPTGAKKGSIHVLRGGRRENITSRVSHRGVYQSGRDRNEFFGFRLAHSSE